MAAALRRLQRKLERLAGRLCEMRDHVDEAASALEDLVSRLPAGMTMTPTGGRRPPFSPHEQGVMRAENDAGAATVHLSPHADGSCDVSVNNRRAFRLPPRLATLLTVLASQQDQASDGLTDWQSKAAVAVALSKRTGRLVSASNVTKSVHMLRKAFREAGENWLLVQTHRERGVRFALRR